MLIHKSDLNAVISDIDLYKATTNSDTTEGRGGTILIGYFVSKGVAEKAAKGRGVMGYDGQVDFVKCKVVTKNDTGESWTVGEKISILYEDPAEVRARALSKLTQEERAALGLK